MKIAVLVEHFPPRMGSDRRIFELGKRLASRHQVNFLLIPAFRELQGMVASTTSEVHGTNTFTYQNITAYCPEIPTALRNLWKRSLMIAYVLSMLLLIPKVIRTLKKINPHVILLNYPSVYTGVLGFLAAKVLRKRCVVDFSDLIAQYTISLLGLENSRLVRLLVTGIQDLIVKNSDAVIAPTDFVRDYALRRGTRSENVFVLPNGVDFQIFDYRKWSDYRSKLDLGHEKVCLYFGRLDEWAGMQILMETSNAFGQKHPDVRFLVVGGGGWRQKFPSNVTVTDEVPHNKVPEIIATADVVLVPFPENEVSHAASPLKLFEAMAMEKPIIASRVSGVCEVIKDGYNGLLADPEKPREWIEAIEAVLDSKSLQSKLRRNALESAKEYDWDILASKFERILLTTAQRKEADE